MDDVLIVGAGPAGSVAATVLARAGVRVRLVDRASFPRHKLCGDTVNPGTLALLRRLRLAEDLERRGLPVTGMRVTGEGGVAIEGQYPSGLFGLAITRAELDTYLVECAVSAGAQFEPSTPVRSALVSEGDSRTRVGGVSAGMNGTTQSLPARVTIAADGRRSVLTFGLRLAHHPAHPRRWAIGAYFDLPASASVGEMHIRHGRYIGVAPVSGGLTNVCLVKPARAGECDFRDPTALLLREIADEPLLRDRLAGRQLVAPPTLLGPLAVDVAVTPIEGLLLAGDAAGFVDPMTGDGLRFAVRGGELAAIAALQALEHGWSGVHHSLAEARQRDFSSKYRFNRALRALVGSSAALRAAVIGSRLAPSIVRALVARAGDCDLALMSDRGRGSGLEARHSSIPR